MGVDLRVTYTQKDVSRLSPYLTGWIKTHVYIRSLPVHEDSLIELQKMISIEMNTQKRYQIVVRVRERFSSIRRDLEDEWLYGLLPKPKKTIK